MNKTNDIQEGNWILWESEQGPVPALVKNASPQFNVMTLDIPFPYSLLIGETSTQKTVSFQRGKPLDSKQLAEVEKLSEAIVDRAKIICEQFQQPITNLQKSFIEAAATQKLLQNGS